MNSEENALTNIAEHLPPGAAKVLSAAAAGMTPGIKDTASDIFGALVGDRVKLWRVRNLINGLEKTAAHIENKGIDLSQAHSLPYGEMLALFDGISKEDDADLSDLWARLLAGAMCESGESILSSRSVASVLEQMSPDAAQVFLLLAKMYRLELPQGQSRLVRHKDFLAPNEIEQNFDEGSLEGEKDQLSSEIDKLWESVKGDVQLEISKSELLRLNLIQGKEVHIFFDEMPFRRGMNVNADGLDSAFSDLTDKIRELVDSRTKFSARPFRNQFVSNKANFELSVSGVEIAKKLGILDA
ncbi:hypothetical protein SAMN04488045_2555 [Thalassococcus halodurans]|uniref:DUF4393 domain-containing protein n=1 Tax=Thalassococcus halodurans TaxID=373675 RepID=A0A1H5ZQ31_9RHOB|nr:hypothetical protein [Thalassococcus halodurans]SEG38114.1 hypothetical protein SAMN04488045_2555 [Thalassococcus halodurans]